LSGLASIVHAFLLAGCGTLASPGAGDENLPSAGLGPFRALDADEVDLEPFVSASRGAWGGSHAALLEDGTFALYRGEIEDGIVSIVRETSTDGITFADPAVVLVPEAAWEGDAVSDPCVTTDGARWLLYYAGAEGIGLAESVDGIEWTRASEGPVLRADAEWEGSRVGAPSVVPDEDGGFVLYYEAGGGIGVATSRDGLDWTRIGAGPVVAPGFAGAWDDRAVFDPAARVHRSPTGRRTVQLFYVGVAAAATGEEPDYGIGAASSFDGREVSRNAGNPVLERSRAIVGLGPPVDLGPADLLTFTEERSTAGTFGIGGAIWPAEWGHSPTP